MASSLPTTSSIKPVEFFLIYNIVYPFITILLAVCIQVSYTINRIIYTHKSLILWKVLEKQTKVDEIDNKEIDKKLFSLVFEDGKRAQDNVKPSMFKKNSSIKWKIRLLKMTKHIGKIINPLFYVLFVLGYFIYYLYFFNQ